MHQSPYTHDTYDTHDPHDLHDLHDPYGDGAAYSA